MKRNCTDHPIVPEINSVSTVEERDRWVCSGAFKDEVNAVINTCGANILENRQQQCGNYMIDLTNKRRSFTKTLAQLPLWGSCTYRVHTKCGYPGFTYNSESDITGEFDIAYTYYEGQGVDDDINTWDFNATSTYMGSFTTQKENTTHVVPGSVDHSAYEDCSTDDRNLYITVTRVKINTPAAPEVDPIVEPSNDEGEVVTPQSRLLQTPQLSNIFFSFTISGA